MDQGATNHRSQPSLIQYRDLLRCSHRIDEIFEWKGWRPAAPDGTEAEVLVIHGRRLGCFRSAAEDGPGRRGCLAMPLPFGDFVVRVDARPGGGLSHRHLDLELHFFPEGTEDRRDLWSGRLELDVRGPRDAEGPLRLESVAGTLDRDDLRRRFDACRDRATDPIAYPICLGAQLIESALRP